MIIRKDDIMKKLEMYKKLSEEDKNNLTSYCMYRSIFTIARNYNKELSDDEVERLEELANYIYLKDEYYNFSSGRISDFLTQCYVEKDISLDKLEEQSWNDVLEAIDNDDLDFISDNEEEMER